ncbi:Ig-like domain-containing protein [Corallococcus sp. M7]
MRAPASPPLPASFRIGCLLALSLALACTRDAAAPAATAPPPAAVPEAHAPDLEKAPFDVGAIIRQVHFAWRPENGAWSGGHSTYAVRSGAEGLTLTPYHHPRKPDAAPRPGVVTKARKSVSPLAGAPLTLGTPGLKRGARRLGDAVARERVEQDGHLVLARGDVTEHLRNAEDGVEQSWTFEHAPAGLGDLVVEVPVKGLTYQGTTGTGLHFTDARTGLGFRYGHGTWVDGRGQRTPVEARFVEGHIQLRVPAGVLDASAYPAVLDPRISPEFGMDTPVVGRQVGDQTGPVVSANGSTWLVVWHDYAATTKQVTGTRVSSSGQVLDVNGITLPRGDKVSSRLSIAPGASDWLIVWEESTRDIYGTRVSLGGQVLDPSGIPIAALPGYQYAPAVVSSGSEYFVVWHENSGSVSVIWGTRLSSAGLPVGSPVRISPSTGFATTPDIAFNGVDYLVVWQDYTSARAFDIRGARVASAGTLRDAFPLSLCAMDGNQWHPAVAANSGSWLVVWEDQRADSFDGDIYGTVVSNTGSVSTPNGRVLTSLLGSQSYPDVVARGYSWFVVWEDARNGYPDIYGTGVDWDGTPSYRGPVAVSAQYQSEYLPSVASSGGDLLVVWHEAHTSGYDVRGARVTTQDVVRDTTSILLSTAPNDQYTPAVARTGTDYLVVWRDNRAGESDIYGVRVTSQGVVLDPSGIPLCTVGGEQDNPTVASNGTDWMVAWDDNRYDATDEILYGVRVSTAGVIRSAWSIGTASWAMRRPALASDGTDWYVVWEDGRGQLSSASWDIFGAKVTASGTVTPTYGTNLTSGNTGSQLEPDIAFNGAEYLVAWTDYRSYVTNEDDIYAAHVSRAGAVRPVGGFVLSNAPGRQVAPAVAASVGGWLVVWQDGRNASQDIYGTRVAVFDTALDPSGLAIATTSTAQRNPTVASDGVNYFVAWEEQTSTSNQDIHGAQVSGATGALIEAPFAIAASPQNEVRPATASHAPSQFLLLYQRTDPAVSSLAERIQARLINLNHAPVAEARSLTTAEDVPLPVTLAATDADGDALTFTIVTPPTHGTLSGTPPALTYRPSNNFNGADSFTYRATDSSGESSAVVTVSLTITPVNDPPTGDTIYISSSEDQLLNIRLLGVDPEGESVTFSVQTLPEHGTLTGTPPDLKYTPVPDYHGTDGFTYVVTDASGATSKPIQVSIRLSPMNDFPEAYAQSASLDQDTSVDLVLEGSDVDGDPLTFSITQQPAHGTLSGTAPNVRYTPAPGYHGPDSFTFRVQDPQAFPASATVSLTVKAINVAPVAHAQSATLGEDTARPLALSGSDADGDVLTYAIATGPAHGALSGTPPQVTYTPTTNFHGEDSFTFIVRDTSGVASPPATVALTVTAENDAPVAQAQAVETGEDVALLLTLPGSDVDGDALTVTVATLPEHGTLSGTPPDVTYTPHADFHGEDGFTFQVTDAEGTSSMPARVSVTVTPVNDTPVAHAQSASLDQDTSVDLVLEGSDVDGDTLTFHIDEPPAHGTLSGTTPNVRYTPAPGYRGPDSFTFRVQDPVGFPASATVSLTVRAVNIAPVAHAQSATLGEDTARPLTLSGSDADGDALTYTIVTGPAHGALSGTPPEVTYTPTSNFHGSDSFRFIVRDTSGVASSPALVSLTVTADNDAPVAQAQVLETKEDVPFYITLAGSDVDGDALTFTIVTPPSHGTLSGTPPVLTYRPSNDFNGADSFTYRATDTSGESSEPARVSVTITPVNDPPTGSSLYIGSYEDRVLDLRLQASDPEGDAFTIHVHTLPQHGTLTGTPPDLKYTPTPNYHGDDSFTFIATDALGAASKPTPVSITLAPMNDYPVAYAQSASLDQDTSVDLVLEGSDVDGDSLTFSITMPPAHGTLSGTAPNVRYTPAPGYRGPDSFTFRVQDPVGFPASATVSLTVRAVNIAPVAHAQSATLGEDTARPLTLSGSDADGDVLTYTIVTGPAHGALSGTPPEVTYSPTPNFHGEDSFTFIVRDTSGVASPPATVALTVTAENDAPVAQAQSLETEEDVPLPLTLAGSDVDGDALTFTVATLPVHGTLSGTPPDVTYTPHTDFHGEDGFTFQVTDAAGTSSMPARVSVTVTPVNDAPVARAKAVPVVEDGWADFVLEGQDADGEVLAFTVRTQLLHGVLTGTPPDLRYTPAGDFHGEDRFTFTVSDASGAESAAATVTLTVSPVNDAPVAQAQSASLNEDTELELVLRGTDVDGDTLTFALSVQPEHGTLSGTPPDVTYTPATDFHGEDSFTFTVTDGRSTSMATVSLTVRPVNDAPIALDQVLQVEPEPSALILAGTDADGDTLTFAIHTPPEHGTLGGTPPELTFTPAEGFRGTTTFTFTASDGLATSAPATVTLRVGNSAPVVAVALQTQRPFEGETLHFQTTAADANGDALTFTWDFGDGASSEEASPLHVYANEGTYEAVLTVTDGIDTVRRSWVLEVRNAAPVLVPVEAPARADEGEALTFHAQARDSGEQDTLTFTWDFGDGSAPASGPEAPHTYADSGLYTVKVTVTDDAGAFSQEVREVRVDNLPPVPEPVPTQTLRGGDTVSLQLKATDAAGDRDPLTWSLVEGPGTVTPEGLYTWKTEARTGGHFPVRIRVMDDDEGSAELVLDLTVRAQFQPELPPDSTGCGCASSQGGAASSVTLLLVVALLVSRRRPPTHRRSGGA